MNAIGETMEACEFLLGRMLRKFVLGEHVTVQVGAHRAKGRHFAGARQTFNVGYGRALRRMDDDAVCAAVARADNMHAAALAIGCSPSGLANRLARINRRKKGKA